MTKDALEMTTRVSGGGDLALVLDNISKTFRLFSSRRHQLLHTLGLGRLVKGSGDVRQKAALSGIDLSIHRGEKVGLIGQNGAGKTTLLHIVTGYVQPTGGQIRASGKVQALMAAGSGVVDEMSGLDCIRQALIVNGLTSQEERDAYEDIVDFVELGDFLSHPVRTYSLGMRARLEFAIATAIKPEILVIDEVLGAGDGYFAKKCARRMRNLTGDATLLLVSHSMQQIGDYCDRVIWLNEGKIVGDGDVATVVKSYETYMMRRDAEIQAEARAAEIGAPAQGSNFADTRRTEAGVSVASAEGKSREMLRGRSRPGGQTPRLRFAAFAPGDAHVLASETGQPVRIRVEITVPEGWVEPVSLSVYAFSESGAFLWDSCPVEISIPPGESDVELSTDRIMAGVGNYVLSIAMAVCGDAERKNLDVLHACLAMNMIVTNYSDPPVFHCESRWRYGDDSDFSEDGRINAWV